MKAAEKRAEFAFRFMALSTIVNVFVGGATNHPFIALFYGLVSLVLIKYIF
ncbi:hypothetical protein [Metabacillus litoralis]|uniref:hypothetical protein n=1 Tax=Metabacillus litoralis TaxID=152268 RepID=UPI001CFD22B5|nr:hypothetical protein [Metabacillus litoralis]